MSDVLIPALISSVAILASAWLAGRASREAAKLSADQVLEASRMQAQHQQEQERIRALRDQRKARAARLEELLDELDEFLGAALHQSSVRNLLSIDLPEVTRQAASQLGYHDQAAVEALIPEVEDLVRQHWEVDSKRTVRIFKILSQAAGKAPPHPIREPWQQLVPAVAEVFVAELKRQKYDVKAVMDKVEAVRQAIDRYVVDGPTN